MRFLMLCISVFMLSLKGNAQENIPFELGVMGGLNLSNVVGPDVSGNSPRVGLHLGAYSQFDIQNNFGFRPEIHLFSRKGTASGNYKSLYLDIPLLATYNLDDNFKVLFGLQPSLLLNAKVYKGQKITNDIRSIDFSLVVGGWYQLDDQFGFGARVVPGIRRVGADGIQSTYNFNFQLSVGYRFY